MFDDGDEENCVNTMVMCMTSLVIICMSMENMEMEGEENIMQDL